MITTATSRRLALLGLPFLLSLFVGLAKVDAAGAETITWNVGYVRATGSSYLATIETVPERIAKATDGRLKIELYDTLVKGPDQPAAVRDGRLDASFAVIPWLSAEAPYLNFGSLPGLLTAVDQYQKMLDPLLRVEMNKVWNKQYNAVQVMTGIFETQCVLSRDPIHTVADFKGKKIRVHNTEAGTLMTHLGAAPTVVNYAEIVPALQRGVVDAVMTSVGPANGMGYPSVVHNISIWKIGNVVPWALIVNQQKWDELPADLKTALEKEFRAIENEHFAADQAFSQEKIDLLLKAGMKLYEAPQSELDKLFSEDNVKAIYENWYTMDEHEGVDGRELVKKIMALKAKM